MKKWWKAIWPSEGQWVTTVSGRRGHLKAHRFHTKWDRRTTTIIMGVTVVLLVVYVLMLRSEM